MTEFKQLRPMLSVRPTVAPSGPDQDPGDEHLDSGWIRYTLSLCKFESVMIGCSSPLFWPSCRPVAPDHDGGDEDDAYNYRPSGDPLMRGMRFWELRDPS